MLSGQHLCLSTATSSGKSLVYTLPMLTTILNTRARALLLFPTKVGPNPQELRLIDHTRASLVWQHLRLSNTNRSCLPPQQALAQDQLRSLRELLAGNGTSPLPCGLVALLGTRIMYRCLVLVCLVQRTWRHA